MTLWPFRGKHQHDGSQFDILHLRLFVQCQICRKWRLRRKGEVFFVERAPETLVWNRDWKIRMEVASGKEEVQG